MSHEGCLGLTAPLSRVERNMMVMPPATVTASSSGSQRRLVGGTKPRAPEGSRILVVSWFAFKKLLFSLIRNEPAF